MATKLDELLKTLTALIELLEEDGEEHWSAWMRQVHTRLLNSDFSGIEKLLFAYGGMGSFNDLVVGQSYENGQFRWEEGYADKNERLSELRSRAWELADSIRRNAAS